jgi:hypothetical protein
MRPPAEGATEKTAPATPEREAGPLPSGELAEKGPRPITALRGGAGESCASRGSLQIHPCADGGRVAFVPRIELRSSAAPWSRRRGMRRERGASGERGAPAAVERDREKSVS